jgi:hypothetical protein
MVFKCHFQQYFSYITAGVLLVEETGVPRENNGTVASHWIFFPHNVVSSTHCLRGIWTHNVSGDR